MDVPEIDFTDPAVLTDPVRVYGEARERAPVARLLIPGMPMWAVLRHAEARAVLADPRFALSRISYQRPPMPPEQERYLRSLQELDGDEHTRLRRLVSPAFTPRRAADLRGSIRDTVGALLDALPEHGPVDLLAGLARPLPMEVICDVVGIPAADRPRWHGYGEVIAAGRGDRLVEIIPAFLDDAMAAVGQARRDPGDDVLSELVRARDADGDRLSEVELVGLVWQLVLGGQTPTNLVANGVAALLAHPDQAAALRADPSLLPGAVEELMRWCGPQLLTFPRSAVVDAEIAGVPIAAGDAVVVSTIAANRDPRAFADPDRLDVTRPPGAGHLGFAHGPHFCLGAALARTQTAIAIGALLNRFPHLALARRQESHLPVAGGQEGGFPEPGPLRYLPDPGTWRLAELSVVR